MDVSHPRYIAHASAILEILRSAGYDARLLEPCGRARVPIVSVNLGAPGFTIDFGKPVTEADLRRLLGPVRFYSVLLFGVATAGSIFYNEPGDWGVWDNLEKIPYFLRAVYPRGTILVGPDATYRVATSDAKHHGPVPTPYRPLHVSRRGDVWVWYDDKQPYRPSAGSAYVGNALDLLGLPPDTPFDVDGDRLFVGGRMIGLHKAALTEDGKPRVALVFSKLPTVPAPDVAPGGRLHHPEEERSTRRPDRPHPSRQGRLLPRGPHAGGRNGARR